ncbi:MAG: lipid-A-disaccharide synthase, partial [archaeon]|nr:lipid-A-disaccharide synthase [archaeon]
GEHNKQKVSFIISKADSIKRRQIEMILKKSDQQNLFKISDRPVKEIFIKSDLVIAASGTVTLEAALCCVPTIIVYKMSWITYQIAKKVVKIKYAGLANLILNREVMPELLQGNASCEKISGKAIYMLDNLKFFENQLQMVRKMLGNKGVSYRTARLAVRMI